jgi:putative spermidine/putrescine transport system ATP-binding protein
MAAGHYDCTRPGNCCGVVVNDRGSAFVLQRSQSHGAQSAVADAHLVVDRVTKTYQAFTAVENLSLTVPRGKLVALLGPSGCGKSTTLRMIAGLVPVSSGRIVVGDRDITGTPPHRRDIGLVFQSYALFPHLSVAQNIAFGLKTRGLGRAEIARKVEDAIRLVHLQGLAERYPKQLSGGQQQRVALARALVIEPSMLLLDEPLSNLDAKLRDQMRNEIRDIQQRLAITTVFVTHDQVEALAMCDLVAVMNQGRLEQVGTPLDVYEQPATAFVAGFVGRTNRFEATGRGDNTVALGRASLRLPRPVSGQIDVMIRPHRIRLHPLTQAPAADGQTNQARGTIRRITFVGDVIQADVQMGDAVLAVETATSQAGYPFSEGAEVVASWRVDDTLAFEARP